MSGPGAGSEAGAGSSTNTLVSLTALRKSYGVGTPIETEVLHGIDLEIEPGMFAAMIGPSGSGKSTLLNVIGLLERPTAGEYRLQGRRIDTLSDDALTAARLSTLGFVFQFHHLLPAFDALENVAMSALIRSGRIDAAARARAASLLDAVGLAQAHHRRPTELSGGMQQRVAIARSLMQNPPLVLADEPTGNLDRTTARQMFELLERLSRELGTAFVVVTHDLELAQRADRILALREGRLGPG